MSRRKSTSSMYMTLQWLYNNLAFILGLASQSQLNGRVAKRRSHRKIYRTRSNKCTQTFEREKCVTFDAYRSSNIQLTKIFNNNNNYNVDKAINDHTSFTRSIENDQQHVLCIHAENKNEAEAIEQLFIEHGSIFKNRHIIDLKDLIQFIKYIIATNVPLEDATTMTDINHSCDHLTSCASLISQTENVRRLKALEYIRIFLEMNKEDFFNYLVNEEQLCTQKISVIYQVIKQSLSDIYRLDYAQNKSYSDIQIE